MDLRSGNSAQRRRRVLREDAGAGEAETTTPRRKTRVRIDAAHYPEAAQPHRQPRIADLIPSRWRSLAAVSVAGAMLAIGILAGFAYLKPLASSLGEEALRPLDLTRPGNLADWMASWTLLGTALVAWVIYSLRRHRADDYRGRYRAWLWTAPAFALGAIDAATGFHQTIAGAGVALTGLTVCGQGAFWWILLEGLLLAAASGALVREFLRCRTSLAVLSLALLAYGAAAAATAYRIDVAASPAVWVAQEGFRLFGHLFLSLSVLLYARHVLREVQGMNKAAKRKRKTKEADDESRVPAPHFRKKATAAREKPSEGSASQAQAAPKPAAPPAPVAAKPASATPLSSATKPATNVPPKPEPSRPAPSPSVGAKPSGNDARSSDARPGEVRRTDPPAKTAGPLASKLRPASIPVAKPAGASAADDDEDDDDRHSRRQKKRR